MRIPGVPVKNVLSKSEAFSFQLSAISQSKKRAAESYSDAGWKLTADS
jgi:hypothetical protein